MTINLNSGKFSSLSAPITFSGGDSRFTVAIGPNSIIERAVGGSGNDVLIGNNANNIPAGDGGNDTLVGGVGNDTLNGGSNNDQIGGGLGSDTLAGGAGLDRFVFNTALNATTNVDRMTDFVAVDDTILLENAIFTRVGVAGVLNSAFFKVGVATDANDFVLITGPPAFSHTTRTPTAAQPPSGLPR